MNKKELKRFLAHMEDELKEIKQLLKNLQSISSTSVDTRVAIHEPIEKKKSCGGLYVGADMF